jgi:hypothetical protein
MTEWQKAFAFKMGMWLILPLESDMKNKNLLDILGALMVALVKREKVLTKRTRSLSEPLA